jgi:Heterokaryon incompatibility protein (HET)
MRGSIYKKAYGIVAWLGQEGNRSSEAIEIIKVLAEEIGTNWDGDVERLSKPAPHSLLMKLDMQTSKTSLFELAFSRKDDFISLLSDRSFWKRAWILQELVLAQRAILLCGRTSFQYDDIRNVAAWIKSLRAPAKPASVDAAHWLQFKLILESSFYMPMRAFLLRLRNDEVLPSAGPHAAAWKVFASSWPLQATDPRDKV